MKKGWIILILVLVLAGALTGGYFGYQALAARFSPSNAPTVPPLPSPSGGDSSAAVPSEALPPDGPQVTPGYDEGRKPSGGTEEPSGEPNTPAGTDTAPDFSVQDRDGSFVRLSDFFGKPMVVNIWASWCGPCVGELPGFQSMYETYGGEITFLMVNLTDGYDETVEGVTAFVEQNGYTFPVYFDVNYDLAITYGITSIPETLFIDAEGHIVATQLGSMQEPVLEAYLLQLLAN